MMLIVSFFALLTGIFCLHQEMKSYEFNFDAKDPKRDLKNTLGPETGNQSTWRQPIESERALVLRGPRRFDPLA